MTTDNSHADINLAEEFKNLPEKSEEKPPLRQGDIYGADAYIRGLEKACTEHKNKWRPK